MCKEHTTKLKVNSAVRTLGRTEVGISATPEHVSCTPCRQFASIAGLFSAVRVVLDGPVPARDAVIEATLRDRGWTSLRGRGRRTAGLRAELAWAKRTRALPPMLPHQQIGRASCREGCAPTMIVDVCKTNVIYHHVPLDV